MPPALSTENRCVIMLHGLGRSTNTLWTAEQFFAARDYQVYRLAYPSTKKDLDQLGRRNFIDTVIKAGRVVDRSLPLPSTWQIPGWRMSAFSDDILTRSLAETHLGPL